MGMLRFPVRVDGQNSTLRDYFGVKFCSTKVLSSFVSRQHVFRQDLLRSNLAHRDGWRLKPTNRCLVFLLLSRRGPQAPTNEMATRSY